MRFIKTLNPHKVRIDTWTTSRQTYQHEHLDDIAREEGEDVADLYGGMV
ncbi:MAG: hypothetical protein ACYDAA_03210 [Syntrophales bacterium]